ncbi:MAG: hypothetical protein PGN08_06925 [Sphingomonas taxi]
MPATAAGFVTYSEGVNDDFNQFLWFRLGWSPDADPATVAKEYAATFIGDPRAAALPAALEANWVGDPATNAAIPAHAGARRCDRPGGSCGLADRRAALPRGL